MCIKLRTGGASHIRKFKKTSVVILLIYFLFAFKGVKAEKAMNLKVKSPRVAYNILIDISEFKLYLISKKTNEVIKTYPIASGKKETPSPYGTWTITEKSSNWGKGFGSRWLGLNVPWGRYGIHGTNRPESINNPLSHGCIRMNNKDVEDLYKYVNVGTVVVIYGGPYNMHWYSFRTLAPGDKGADVLEVQRVLMNKKYYTGSLNGVYSEYMKSKILKFKKENNLRYTHFLDKEFYNALGMEPFE
ncbi:L,D-transpeptidase family protein [Clostridium malenominatum]|uniref:L,D-transpeptidase family protein n=1 Tax=Clostridium malenominatum TaxID=1539 RepID=A0ABN1IRL8_9CLOT